MFKQTSQEHLVTNVLPLLVRAYDDTDSRMQEEVLRRTVSLAKQLDMKVKQCSLSQILHLDFPSDDSTACCDSAFPSVDFYVLVQILEYDYIEHSIGSPF